MDEQTTTPTLPSEASEVDANEQMMNDLLNGNDLDGKTPEELVTIIKGERADAQMLLAKFGMGLMLNSGLFGAAKNLVDARLPHPKHDEKSKTFLVYKEEFTDLVSYLHSAKTDFHELVIGELQISMRDVIQGYQYILEQRKISGQEIAKNLTAERDELYHKVNFFLVQLVKAHRVEDKSGFDQVMTLATTFVTDMEAAAQGKSGAQAAKEQVEQEQTTAEEPPPS